MEREGDRPVVASEQAPGSNTQSNATLKAPVICLAFVLMAQLALVCCAWKIPTLIVPAVMISIMVFVAGIFALRWLLSSANRSIAASNSSQSELANTEVRAIFKLDDELQPLLKGDLRVRAAVSEQGLAASVGRTANHMITELRWLVGRFQEFGNRIDALVEVPRTELLELHGEYRSQAAAIHESANALAAMTSAMSSLSAATHHASGQAQTAAEEASRAATLISNNEERVLRIRAEAGNATRYLLRLNKTTSSVNTRMASIIEVARRADLLALNSTLQVTTKSAGNVELIRLSEEVSELAAALNTTSSDVAYLIGTLQQDAGDAIDAMSQTNRDLSEGFDQLDQLGGTLNSVTRSSTNLHSLVDQMAEKTLLQTSVVKGVYSRMVSINDLSDSYTSGARAWSTSLDELRSLALELRSSVADFQLPKVPAAVEPTQVQSVTRRGKKSVLADD